MQIIIGGGQPGLFGSYRDGFELFDKARSAKKDLFIVPGATHYDKPDCVDQAVGKLKSFYGENL